FGVLLGASAALAMLGHGSTAFVLIGMALSALLLWRWASWRLLAAAMAAFAVLYLPWMAYQKFADPPGDRLVKWHLAGVQEVDPRPLGEVLREAYASQTPATFLANKQANVDALTLGLGQTYARTRKAASL